MRARRTALSVPILGLLLVLASAAALNAATLLRMDAGGGGEATLITLQFAEDPGLELITPTGTLLALKGTPPMEIAAAIPTLGWLEEVEADEGILRFHTRTPMRATLRSAGAGRYLFVVRPAPDYATPGTQEPVSPTSPSPRAASPSNPEQEGEWTPVYQPRESSVGADPGAELLMETARVLVEDGNEEKALTTLDAIPEDSPAYGRGLLLRGEIEEQRGNPDRAEEAYRQALQHPESQGGAAARLALRKQQEGDDEDVVSLWEYVLASGDATVPPLVQDAASARTEEPDPAARSGEGSELDRWSNDREEPRESLGVEVRHGEAAGSAGDSPIQFDSESEPVTFTNTRLLVLGSVIAFLAAGFVILFAVLRNKRLQEERTARSQGPELDDVFWGDAPSGSDDPTVADGGSAGSLADELDAIDPPPEIPPESPKPSAERLSSEKRKRIADLQSQGFTVREIAESTGSSQDEVRMALQMQDSEA